MPDHQRRHLILPEDFAVILRRMHTKRDRRLDAVLHAAVAAGWTKRSLANALGCSNQNVAQRMQRAPAQREVSLPAIPSPPLKTDPKPQPDACRLSSPIPSRNRRRSAAPLLGASGNCKYSPQPSTAVCRHRRHRERLAPIWQHSSLISTTNRR